jgi:quercetin dioxygenase-like cupin family protein
MRILSLPLAIALLFLPLRGGAQDAVPVHLEARHRLVLDSIRFRVLDVQIPAGDTTRYHIHDTAIIYIALRISPTSAQHYGSDWPSAPASPPFAEIGDVAVDSLYVAQPVTHRVANAGDGMFRLLAITSSGPKRERGREEADNLPGVVELRSTWFQQSRVSIPGQAATEWFESDYPVLIVQPQASRLALLYEKQARQPLVSAGGWTLVPARVRYRLDNEGREPATAVAIAIR